MLLTKYEVYSPGLLTQISSHCGIIVYLSSGQNRKGVANCSEQSNWVTSDVTCELSSSILLSLPPEAE